MRFQNFAWTVVFAATLVAAPVPSIWQRNFANSGKIIPTRDGGGLVLSWVDVTGQSTDTDLRLIRIDSRGDILWTKDYGGTSLDYGDLGVELDDGSFIIAGETWSPVSRNKTSPYYGSADFWFLRVTARGDLLWERSWGGSGWDAFGQLHVFGDVIFATGDTDSPVSGNKTSPSHSDAGDICVVRLNLAGEILWDKTYGGTHGQFLVESLAADQNRLYLIAASLNPPSLPEPPSSPRYFSWVVAIDGEDGGELWNNSYSTDGYEIPRGATFLGDGNIAMASTFLTKINSATGAPIWQKTLNDDYVAIAPGPSPSTVVLVTAHEFPRNSDIDDRYYTIAEYDASEEPLHRIQSPRFGDAQTFISPLRHAPGRGYFLATTVQRYFPEHNIYGVGGDILFWYLDEQLEGIGSFYLGGSASEILSQLEYSSTGDVFVIANSESDRSLTKTTRPPGESVRPHNWFFKIPGWFTQNPRATELFIEPSAFLDDPTGATPLVLRAAQDGQLSLQYSDDLLNWQPLQTIDFSADPAHTTDPTRVEKRFYRLAPAN